MAASHGDIDRLIEDGLDRYGAGDLEGALLRWEEALALDPENAQANSYVDYVRLNYEVLTGEAGADDAPFAITEDEPEYQIEILPGEVIESAQPAYAPAIEEGWLIDDEARGVASGAISSRAPTPPSIELELEADEPPDPPAISIEADEPPLPEPEPVSFEDATAEYPGGPKRREVTPAPEFEPQVTPGFETHDVSTPTGFGAQITDIRKRELGFVQPRTESPPRGKTQPPELNITLRTPTTPPPDDSHEPEIELAVPTARSRYSSTHIPVIAPPAATADIELSYSGPSATPPPDDLIASLPSPKPVATRDLPRETRPPAVPSPTATTRDLRPDPPPVTSAMKTRDFEDIATKRMPNRAQLPLDAFDATTERAWQAPAMRGAPTRELGIRPMRPPTEEEPTHEAEISTLRQQMKNVKRTDRTAVEAILEFDPIGARAEEILAEIDQGAPPGEVKEDRTRRRITALLDAAMEWNRRGEYDKAVAAVDLALAEDPNSALAQKLIHRNRDTIMAVFTSFLGDLQRTPVLARPLHELGGTPISPRAAFLLSRIDGTLSLDEILDVSGMPRVEAYRYLCQLFLRGILR
jgi:hypothetical protein